MALFIDRKFERKATSYIVRVSLNEAYKVIIFEERDPKTQVSGLAQVIVRAVRFKGMTDWQRIGLNGVTNQPVLIAKGIPPVVAVSLLEQIPVMMQSKTNHNSESIPWEVIQNGKSFDTTR